MEVVIDFLLVSLSLGKRGLCYSEVSDKKIGQKARFDVLVRDHYGRFYFILIV